MMIYRSSFCAELVDWSLVMARSPRILHDEAKWEVRWAAFFGRTEVEVKPHAEHLVAYLP